APSERATLGDWAARVGASERTMARLFRDEFGMSYQQWRQQAVLAHALPLLARGMPISHVAAASGYASDSAFTAMFKAALGAPPSSFQVRGGTWGGLRPGASHCFDESAANCSRHRRNRLTADVNITQPRIGT
ncbi:MAG: helix-turn-helix transcriptional regulator, partial [Ramlibacter sp.]|nr:helix-turn-helix transcriptional regulator [Ramlibacter sp.]